MSLFPIGVSYAAVLQADVGTFVNSSMLFDTNDQRWRMRVCRNADGSFDVQIDPVDVKTATVIAFMPFDEPDRLMVNSASSSEDYIVLRSNWHLMYKPTELQFASSVVFIVPLVLFLKSMPVSTAGGTVGITSDNHLNPSEILWQKLSDGNDNGDADLLLDCGTKLPVHKLILSAACPFFDAVFRSGMDETQKVRPSVPMTGASVRAAVAIVRFLYVGCVRYGNKNQTVIPTAKTASLDDEDRKSNRLYDADPVDANDWTDIATVSHRLGIGRLVWIADAELYGFVERLSKADLIADLGKIGRRAKLLGLPKVLAAIKSRIAADPDVAMAVLFAPSSSSSS